jgi:hypothetical protein
VVRKLSWPGLVVLPVVFGWIGDLYATRIWHPVLLGHSCPRSGADCLFHPLLVAGITWTVLGGLIGLWAAVTLVRATRPWRPRRFHLSELIIVTPLVGFALWWGHHFGMQQGGTSADFDRFATVVLAAIVVRFVAAAQMRRAHGRAPSRPKSVPAGT